MKKFIYLIFLAVFSLITFNLKAQNLEVTHLANGNTLTIPVQSIDSVQFDLAIPPFLKNIYQNNGNILTVALADIDSITYIIPEVSTLPSLQTDAVTVLSSSSAHASGIVSSDGGSPLTELGICWNTSPNVSIANNKQVFETGLGAFGGNITPLTPDTVYYLRAYATNSSGTAYGNEVSFMSQSASTQGNLPTLNTTSINYEDGLSALCGGSITSDGGLTVTARGVSWVVGDSTPTIDNNHTLDGNGVGDYTSELSNLLPNSSYSIRAYATNSAGTAYGETLSFTTNALAEVVTDEEIDLLINPTLNGEVITTGNSNMQEIGFCWSEIPNPSIEDNTSLSTPSADFTGSFSETISDLTPNQNYYYRAYAINEMGVSYGSIKEFIAPDSEIDALDCDNIETQGNLISNYPNEGVFFSIPYTGGNGGPFESVSLNSTGVEGLIATLEEGVLTVDEGEIVFVISGTATSNGVAFFAIDFLDKNCTIGIDVIQEGQYPIGTVHCDPENPTEVIDVINPTTGKTWMDRNLGAKQVATSSSDEEAYGDLYQWGRGADGHQCRDSETTTTLSSSDQPEHGDFIKISFLPSDWRDPQNDNLWQGLNGVNNPCPSGYRLPTDAELFAERLTWSSISASGDFASPLKFTRSGRRQRALGTLQSVGYMGAYWSSTVLGNNSRLLFFDSFAAYTYSDSRAFGVSVRCIKD